MASIKVATPTITVEALASQFWTRYLGAGGYASPEAAAEALLGILLRVYAQGGREDVRTFLRGIKEQLAPHHARTAAAGPVFALAGALAVAAERLRQFSPVKGHDKLGSCVLEELRLRLYRVITGETFANDTGVRRRALDCCFALMMKEEEAKQRCQQRAAAQRAAAAASAGAAPSAAGDAVPRSPGSFMGGGLRIMSERMPGFSGPDTSTWSAVWGSVMGSTLGHQAMPLLQSVLSDLYATGFYANSTCLGRASAGPGTSSGKGRGSGAAGSMDAAAATACAAAGAGSTASSVASDRSSQLSRLSGPPAAAAAGGAADDVASHGSDRGSPRAASASTSGGGGGGGAGQQKASLGGAAAAFAGRFAAAASGARARMARFSDNGRGREADPREPAGQAPGLPAASAFATAAAPPTPAAAAPPAEPRATPPAASEARPCAVGQARGQEQEAGQQQAQASSSDDGSAASVPKGWVVFGCEPHASSPTSTGHATLTASSCGGDAAAAVVVLPPPNAAATAAAAAVAAAADAGLPAGPCHHRRSSSRTLRFWAEDSAIWGMEDPAVGDAPAAAAVAH